VSELSESQKAALLAAARSAAGRARAKHSGFRVGAAVLDEAGRLHAGCNVESDSYGLTICAERVAIFAALAAGARRLLALAVACPDAARGPAGARLPCGACRQVMLEYLEQEAPVLVEGVGVFNCRALLPHGFRLGGEREQLR
jgi:cytidine deaminase